MNAGEIMDKNLLIKTWLKIDFYYIANKFGFISKAKSVNEDLIYNTIRFIDCETAMTTSPDINLIISLISLMWEYVDKEKYNIRDFVIKILSRIGYPTSAIIADVNFDRDTCSFSKPYSIFDKCTMTINQSRNEILVGNQQFLLTKFQKDLWTALEKESLIGISAPTSAGKSFVILLYTVSAMLKEPLDVIYIVPTLSLLNQVTEDYNVMMTRAGIQDYLITNNLSIGESTTNHTIYVWTQEKAISTLSVDNINSMPNKTILVVDEIQNIERVSDNSDVRAKILYDTLEELRHINNILQIIISGPRINQIDELGMQIFGQATSKIETMNSPVLSLTYSISKVNEQYYFKQYCSLTNKPFSERIEHPEIISGYGGSGITKEYINFLRSIVTNLSGCQNIVFAPTAKAARNIAQELCTHNLTNSTELLKELISYYKQSVNPNYTLCTTLSSGIAYHHGKLPIHVRRTIEKAIRAKLVNNVVCTTTLMQGVNLPAQNVIIRNPHLYTRHYANSSELTNYEMANLRGRAGRLLQDFIGRTFVLDEDEFEETEGYDQVSLFDDVSKDVPTGYEEKFESFKSNIVDVIESNRYVDQSMQEYGYLITYIRQSILKYGKGSKHRLSETGVSLTQKQVAAIIAKLKTLSVPKEICFHNRYWDPFVLDDIYKQFHGRVPSYPTEKGARSRLSEILKFLRDNESTKEMYDRYIPSKYRRGQARGLLCSTCIKWSSEIPLSSLLSGKYYEGEDAADHIEDTIKLLQETVSFNVPLLIKPIVEIRNEKSAIVACLQSGAYKPCTRKMIDIGIPRELAIELNEKLFSGDFSYNDNNFEFEQNIRKSVKAIIPKLLYWEQVQLSFLK